VPAGKPASQSVGELNFGGPFSAQSWVGGLQAESGNRSHYYGHLNGHHGGGRIARERIMIPLDFNGGAFKWGINTSGAMFGGKDKMAFLW